MRSLESSSSAASGRGPIVLMDVSPTSGCRGRRLGCLGQGTTEFIVMLSALTLLGMLIHGFFTWQASDQGEHNQAIANIASD